MNAGPSTPPSNETPWHTLSATQAALKHGVDPARGLDEAGVSRLRDRYGPNDLGATEGRSIWSVLLAQAQNVMVILLAAAAAISLAMREWIDAGAIAAILILNIVIGFVQEYRAEKAHEALRRMSNPRARVRRDSRDQEIDAKDLVPGDVLLLREGDSVGADARIIESFGLRSQEAALTGESTPIDKDAESLPPDTVLAERANMVFKGTSIVGGRTTALVVATGKKTELGRIAGMLSLIEQEPTPLQVRLDKLGRLLAFAALAIVGLVFAIGLFRGVDLRTLFLTSLSLAVAAVPEGLPGVVTIALALGSHRMLKRKALIRRLTAVESLGSVTAICSDKTGTLTQNRMTVAAIHHHEGTEALDAEPSKAALPLLAAATLCSDAQFDGARAVGDPMEAAIVKVAAKLGLDLQEGERAIPRISEVPFDAKRKRMATLHEVREGPNSAWVEALAGEETTPSHFVFVKGAFDSVLEISKELFFPGQKFSQESQTRLTEVHDDLAAQGMRVIAVGYRPIEKTTSKAKTEDFERDLVFLGLIGLIDPLRPEAKTAVRQCRQAGIRPLMITGDHALTAGAIAGELGIDSHRVITGSQVDALDDAELQRIVNEISVFARATPSHKLRIVEALQRNGEIVALTGDGVNDAPALKRSEIGVAMGETGTDVAKEAADMVLLDDNFATVVAAIEEGRTVFDNIRKFVKYLLTSNSAELWVMLVAMAAGMPLPLLPLQILWINLITDGLPALALAMEPPEPHVMKRKPAPPNQGVLDRRLAYHVLWVGMLMGAVSLYFAFFRARYENWQTLLFTTLTISQIAHVLAIRTFRESFFAAKPWKNPFLLVAAGGGIGLQALAVYWPPLQEVFQTSSLSAREFGLCLALSGLIFLAVELEKWHTRAHDPTPAPHRSDVLTDS